MVDTATLYDLTSHLGKVFPVRFLSANNEQFGLEATHFDEKPTIIINSGFTHHQVVEAELFYIYALHEMAHFFGFGENGKLVSKIMVNETWADYWAITKGLPLVFDSAMSQKRVLSKAIDQLKAYQTEEKPIEDEQIKQYLFTESPHVHLPLSYRISFYQSLLNGEGFPDFVCEARRRPH